MIKLALYAYGFWWVLQKMGYTVKKENEGLKGYEDVHDPFEHPMGDLTCNICKHHHPEIEKRIQRLEEYH